MESAHRQSLHCFWLLSTAHVWSQSDRLRLRSFFEGTLSRKTIFVNSAPSPTIYICSVKSHMRQQCAFQRSLCAFSLFHPAFIPTTHCALSQWLLFNRTERFANLKESTARCNGFCSLCHWNGLCVLQTNLTAGYFNPMHPIGEIIVESNCIGTDHIIKGRPTWKRGTR